MMSGGRRIEVRADLKRPAARRVSALRAGAALVRWIVCLTLAFALLSEGALARLALGQPAEPAEYQAAEPTEYQAPERAEPQEIPRAEPYEELGHRDPSAPTILIIDERDYGYPRPERRPIGLLSQLQLGLPFMMSDASTRSQPGANLSARFAMSSAYFGAGFQGGYQWIPADERNGRGALGRAFFGPFAHLQVPTGTVFTPYAQAGFDFNYWNRSERERYCDPFQCFDTRVYRFTPGLHGRLGATFAFGPRRNVAIDVGAEANLSFRGSYFASNEWFLMPYLGLAIRH